MINDSVNIPTSHYPLLDLCRPNRPPRTKISAPNGPLTDLDACPLPEPFVTLQLLAPQLASTSPALSRAYYALFQRFDQLCCPPFRTWVPNRHVQLSLVLRLRQVPLGLNSRVMRFLRRRERGRYSDLSRRSVPASPSSTPDGARWSLILAKETPVDLGSRRISTEHSRFTMESPLQQLRHFLPDGSFRASGSSACSAPCFHQNIVSRYFSCVS